MLLIAVSLAATAGGVVACGEEGISSSLTDEQHRAARLVRPALLGLPHASAVAGTQGSATNVRTREYKDGPNFDQRKVTKNCALYAIRNGGFSSGPMPQNIVVGPGGRGAGRVPRGDVGL